MCQRFSLATTGHHFCVAANPWHLHHVQLCNQQHMTLHLLPSVNTHTQRDIIRFQQHALSYLNLFSSFTNNNSKFHFKIQLLFVNVMSRTINKRLKTLKFKNYKSYVVVYCTAQNINEWTYVKILMKSMCDDYHTNFSQENGYMIIGWK